MIRSYKNSDYEMICDWWDMQYQQGPLPGMMSEHGTFILEHNNEPFMSLTVFKTQTNIGYIEGYICDITREISIEKRREYGQNIWNHCYQWAKENGIQYLVTYTDKEALVNRYEKLGMTKVMNNLTSLSKDLGV